MKKVFVLGLFLVSGVAYGSDPLAGMTDEQVLAYGLQTPQSVATSGTQYASAEAQVEAWLNRPPMSPRTITTEEIARLRAMFPAKDSSPRAAGIAKRTAQRRPTYVNSQMSRRGLIRDSRRQLFGTPQRQMSRRHLIRDSRRSLTYGFDLIAAETDSAYDAENEQ